jgi:acyl carrier protein
MNATPGWDDEFEQVLRTALPALTEFTAQTCLREQGLDSLATIDMLLRLEASYDIAIPDSLLTADTFATPGSLWQVVTSVRSDQAAGAQRAAVAAGER